MKAEFNRGCVFHMICTGLLLIGCSATRIPIGTSGNYDYLYRGGGLGGWEFVGAGYFVEENDSMRTEGGLGVLWYSQKRFEDFELLLEWKTNSESADSGVFVRIANVPEVPRHAIEHGYEVQIKDNHGNPLNQTGAIRGYAPPSHIPTNPVGMWNEMKVIARGSEYNVWINKEHVCTFFSRKTMLGFIGLQNHDENSTVWFRNIRIREF